MAKVPKGIETLPNITIALVGRTNVTDRRQTTNGRTTYERENDTGVERQHVCRLCQIAKLPFLSSFASCKNGDLNRKGLGLLRL